MGEQKFRNKITWFTFIFSILVIWVHSYNAVLFLGDSQGAYRVDTFECFLGNTIAQVAVPGFFLISSYLFFRTFTIKYIWKKWKARFHSILLPYLVWNLLYYIGYVVGSRLPILKSIIGKGTIPFSIINAFDAVFHYSSNYVFWYLNQLIILVLLAPFIYLIIKNQIRGILCFLMVFAAIYIGKQLSYVNLDALLYYIAGGFAAVHGKGIVEKRWDVKEFAVGFGIFMFACLVYGYAPPGEGMGERVASVVLFRLFVPISLWFMTPEFILLEPKEWMRQNFFLYATHFALVRLINKTGAFLLPSVPAIPVVFFLLMPVICVFISYSMAKMIKRSAPGIWWILNGGR